MPSAFAHTAAQQSESLLSTVHTIRHKFKYKSHKSQTTMTTSCIQHCAFNSALCIHMIQKFDSRRGAVETPGRRVGSCRVCGMLHLRRRPTLSSTSATVCSSLAPSSTSAR